MVPRAGLAALALLAAWLLACLPPASTSSTRWQPPAAVAWRRKATAATSERGHSSTDSYHSRIAGALVLRGGAAAWAGGVSVRRRPAWLKLRGGGADSSDGESGEVHLLSESEDQGEEEEEAAAVRSAEDSEAAGAAEGSVVSTNLRADDKESAAAAEADDEHKSFPWRGLFQMAKQMGVSVLAMRVVAKLDPSQPKAVRIARIIYATYLVLHHVLLAWLRVRIWRERDTTEVKIPPPKLADTLSKTLREGLGEGPQAEQLDQMAKNLLMRRTEAWRYDMGCVDAQRRSLVCSSLLMAVMHLRMGMLKPIVLSTFMGVWGVLESPLFRIHALGMRPQGRLARPWLPDTSLNDWVQAKSKASAAKLAAAQAMQAATEEQAAAEQEGGGEGEKGEGGEGEGDAWGASSEEPLEEESSSD